MFIELKHKKINFFFFIILSLFFISANQLVFAVDTQAVTANSQNKIPEAKTTLPVLTSISLVDVISQLNVTCLWEPITGVCLLQKNGHKIQYSQNSAFVFYDYQYYRISEPLKEKDGILYFTEKAISDAKEYFDSKPDPVQYRVGAILIDAGHGGKDPGAVGEYVENGKKVSCVEKDITLKSSLRVYERLKAKYPDKKILLTRNSDTYPTLEERVEMANKVELLPNEAILYISIHANSSLSKSASGYEVWYLTQDYRRNLINEDDVDDKHVRTILNNMMEEEFTMESMLIAKFILDELTSSIGKQAQSRGLKEEMWFVVRNARMPSVLIELGFVSNEKEAKLLNDKQYLQKASDAIYNGLVTFIDHFENSKGFTTVE